MMESNLLNKDVVAVDDGMLADLVGLDRRGLPRVCQGLHATFGFGSSPTRSFLSSAPCFAENGQRDFSSSSEMIFCEPSVVMSPSNIKMSGSNRLLEYSLLHRLSQNVSLQCMSFDACNF